MTFKQLEAFQKTAELENMTKSAKELYIAQPALSKMIKDLEFELGYNLFDRIGKNIVLNKNGEILYKHVKSLQTNITTMRNELNEANKQHNSFIKVSFRVASKILPDLLNSFYKENENINLKIYQVNQFTKATPEFDIVVDAVSSAESLGKNSILLMEEKILLALPKNHFLATKENLALKDLNILPCSLLNSHSSLGKIIITELSERMFFPNIVFESDNPFMVRDFLGLGLSYSFVPEKTWQLNKSYPNIVLRELTDFECSRKIYLQYNSDNFISSSTKKLASHISRYFKNL